MPNTIKLTLEQHEAVSEIENHLQIIACAGSGKTEVITRRIAHILESKQEIEPENIVAFTFTEKAAESLKNRISMAVGEIDVSNMYIGTIHGFCYYLLNQYTDKFRDFRILDTIKSHHFVTRYANECGMSTLGLDVYPRNVNLFLQCIDKMIDDYENRTNWEKEHIQALEEYIDCLYEHQYIDFSLMIFETLKQIAQNENVKQYLSKIKYLVVDEYQDVNDLQEKLILCIAEAGANVCVVGDDDQTIYQFRGSNADNMISFAKRYANVHQVKLETNFRCTPKVVDIADCVISHNEHRLAKKMVSGISGVQTEVVAKRYESKQEEFDDMACNMQNLHNRGVPYRDMAVLVRKGKAIATIVSALEQADIPFETDSAEHFFTGSYFRRFVITLQILADVDKAKLYECWQDIVDDASFQIGFKFLRNCSRGGSYSLGEILQGFCEKISFLHEKAEDLEVRRMDLDGILKILNDYDEIYRDWQLSARVNGILKFLGTQAEDEYRYHTFRSKEEYVDAVQIMTVHKAKGLEFHTVFLPELMQREFPVSNMGGKKYWHVLGGCFEDNKERYESSLEDERKLFYVATTRAKRNLYLTYELSTQPVSCFVKEAAESSHLVIDEADLHYNPKGKTENYVGEHVSYFEHFDHMEKSQAKIEQEQKRREEQEYRAIVKYAKEQLYDYYGTGAHFCPAMYSMIAEIKRWSPDKILREAIKIGLI